MNQPIQPLLAAIAAYEAKCGITAPDSILENLWYDYSCRSPMDDGRLRLAEQRLSPIFEELSVSSSDRLTDLIVELVNAYQRAAYLEGFRTGARLMEELT